MSVPSAPFVEQKACASALHFRAGYIRGRRVETDITVRSDGSVTVATVGRGKSPLRWLDRLKGKH